MYAAIVSWPTATLGSAFFLGMFWFLGRASGASSRSGDSFWQYKTATETGGLELNKEIAELRDDVRALRGQVDDLTRLLNSVE